MFGLPERRDVGKFVNRQKCRSYPIFTVQFLAVRGRRVNNASSLGWIGILFSRYYGLYIIGYHVSAKSLHTCRDWHGVFPCGGDIVDGIAAGEIGLGQIGRSNTNSCIKGRSYGDGDICGGLFLGCGRNFPQSQGSGQDDRGLLRRHVGESDLRRRLHRSDGPCRSRARSSSIRLRCLTSNYSTFFGTPTIRPRSIARGRTWASNIVRRFSTIRRSQKAAAEASKERLEKSGKFRRPIVTEITAAGPFYRAEEYHQQYLLKHGQASCKVH